MSAHWYWDWDWGGGAGGDRKPGVNPADTTTKAKPHGGDGNKKEGHVAGDQAPFPFPSVKPCQKVQVFIGGDKDQDPNDYPHYPPNMPSNTWQQFSQQEQYEDTIGTFKVVGVGPAPVKPTLSPFGGGGSLDPSTTYYYYVTATYTTNQVDTLPFADTGSSGSPTFRLTVDGTTTAPITYTTSANDLVSNINTALKNAFNPSGPSPIVASTSAPPLLSAIILTFSGGTYANRQVGAFQALPPIGASSYTGFKINGSSTASICKIQNLGMKDGDPYSESSASDESPYPPDGSTTAITVSWPPPSSVPSGATLTGFKVYRGTATGQELLLASVPYTGAANYSYNDTGLGTQSIPPPNPKLWYWIACEQSGSCCKRCQFYKTMSLLPGPLPAVSPPGSPQGMRPVGPAGLYAYVYVDDFKCRCVPNTP